MRKEIRKLLTLCTALILTISLCACGAYSENATAEACDYAYAEPAYEEAYYETTSAVYAEEGGDYYPAESSDALYDSNSLISGGNDNQNALSEKIIYSATVSVETTDFDGSLDGVYKLVEAYNGFVENSSVSGSDYSASYYGNQTYRFACFTIRVPSESFSAVKGSIDSLGYVTSVDTYSDNITTNYYDTQSRLEAYQTESKRLIEMLEKADTVEEMIYIESRLSEVEYYIDSLTSTLRNWQNQVDYSTITIYINEVAEIHETVSVKETYWQKMIKGFNESLAGIGNFFKALLMWIVVASPVIILVGIIGLVMFILIRRKVRRDRQARYEREYAQNIQQNMPQSFTQNAAPCAPSNTDGQS